MSEDMQFTQTKRDPKVEETLLANGFKFYQESPNFGWGYLAQSWSTAWERYSMQVSRCSDSYQVVLTAHYGGENRTIQMGNSNSAEDILRLLAALKKML